MFYSHAQQVWPYAYLFTNICDLVKLLQFNTYQILTDINPSRAFWWEKDILEKQNKKLHSAYEKRRLGLIFLLHGCCFNSFCTDFLLVKVLNICSESVYPKGNKKRWLLWFRESSFWLDCLFVCFQQRTHI